MLSSTRVYFDFLLQNVLFLAAIAIWFSGSPTFSILLILLLIIQLIGQIQIRRRYYGQRIGVHLISYSGLVVLLLGGWLQPVSYFWAWLLAVFGLAQVWKNMIIWKNRPKSFWDI